MTALKIKNELMQIISNTDDIDILRKIKDTAIAIQEQADGLTEDQLKLIEKNEESIREGRVQSHKEVQESVATFFEGK